jgi:hypothetical protein
MGWTASHSHNGLIMGQNENAITAGKGRIREEGLYCTIAQGQIVLRLLADAIAKHRLFLCSALICTAGNKVKPEQQRPAYLSQYHMTTLRQIAPVFKGGYQRLSQSGSPRGENLHATSAILTADRASARFLGYLV